MAAPVARLLDVLLHVGVLVFLRAVKEQGVPGGLSLGREGARRLAGVLARVHEHHRLMPLAQCLHYLQHMHYLSSVPLKSKRPASIYALLLQRT